MGCLKLNYAYDTDLKISWVNKCVRSEKSVLKVRSSYLFGFNGQEKDNELKGKGNSLAFNYRIHDSRLGRFLSVDPLYQSFPWNSSYAFAENRVIDGIDLEGLEHYRTADNQLVGKYGDSKEVRVVHEDYVEEAIDRFKNKTVDDEFNKLLMTRQRSHLLQLAGNSGRTEMQGLMAMAEQWGVLYNGSNTKFEWSSAFYRMNVDGADYINFTEPRTDWDYNQVTVADAPSGFKGIAIIHNHPIGGSSDPEPFSTALNTGDPINNDINTPDRLNVPSFMTTPKNYLKLYIPSGRIGPRWDKTDGLVYRGKPLILGKIGKVMHGRSKKGIDFSKPFGDGHKDRKKLSGSNPKKSKGKRQDMPRGH